jgi:hypothetical protein
VNLCPNVKIKITIQGQDLHFLRYLEYWDQSILL